MADINQIKVKGVVYDVADEAARNAIKQKQNILIPGDNITIKENVISANVPDTEGAVTGIIMNGKEKMPNANGMVDLGTVVTDVSGKVDKEDGKSLFSGSYDDLTDKPQIPQSVTDLNDAEDYVAIEQLNNKIGSINDALSEKANVNDMSIESGNGSATITLKQGVSTTVLTQHQDISGKADKSEMSVDDVTGDSTKKKVTLKQDTSVDVVVQHQSLANYPTKSEMNTAIQQAGQGETVVINSDGANIVDEHNNNSVLLAPSARQMKLMYDNFIVLYNSLANIAFTDGKPTLDWAGTKTKYTLSYGTLTGCTADVAGGQVNEGALRIKLTPTQASYAFTSVTVNGESASTTATGDADGSVYLDIVVNGNITIAATAISGRSISFDGGGGCTIDAASVANGQDLDTIIRVKEHYTLPSSITVTIGGSSVAHTYTRAQDNKTATLHIDAANITGDLAITCTAVEDNHAVLTFGQLSNVTIKSGTRELESGSHIYDGEAISIKPASGYKLTGKPIFTNGNTTPITLNPTTEGDIYNGYDFVFNPLPNSTIAITNVGATELSHTLRASLTGTGGESVDSSTDLSSNITEGSAWSTVLSVKSTAEEGTAITSIDALMDGGGKIYVNGNTISTNYVTGNITINVVTAVAGRYTISLPDDEHIKVTSDAAGEMELSNQSVADNGTTGWQGYIMGKYTIGSTASGTDSYSSYDVVDVRVMMGSNDVTDSVFNPATGLIKIDAVIANVEVTAKTAKFIEGRYVNPDGIFTDNYYNPKPWCVLDYLAIPQGITKLLVDCGGTIYTTGTTEGAYIAIYNSSKTKISQYQIKGQVSRYKIINLSSLTDPAFIRITYKAPISNGEYDYTIRRTRYVLGFDGNDDIHYIYRGAMYDGRYEDDYEMQWGKYYTGSGDSASDARNYHSAASKKIEIPSGCHTLLCQIGELANLYSWPENNKISNIRLYTSSGVRTTKVTTSANAVFTQSVESGDTYVRISAMTEDTSYIIDMENESFIYRGLLVTETAAELIAAYNNSQNS